MEFTLSLPKGSGARPVHLAGYTIVPDGANVFDYNRYMYVRGNPLKYNDPSGHEPHIPNDPCSYETCQLDPVAGKYVRVKYASPENPCKTSCTGLTDVLAQTLASLKDAKVDISLTYDENTGLPALVFDKNKLIETLATPLQLCAAAAAGACGYSFGGSANAYGGGVRGDVAVYVDQSGTMGVFLEGGGGGYTPLSSPVSKLSIIGIPAATVHDLDGLSAQFGGSGAVGSVGGAAEVVFLKSDTGVSLRGQVYGYAYTPSLYAAELHLTMTWAQPIIYLPPMSHHQE